MPRTTSSLGFGERADQCDDADVLKAYLLQLIETKKTNLCVSADVHSTSTLLRIAEEVGDHICVLKTHADIVDDFGERTIKGLKEISRRKKFLIFEDRKFGDIGSTVQAQYVRGPLAIATWAHIVNAHLFPGPTVVSALRSASISAIQLLRQSVSTEIFVGTPTISSDGDSDEDKPQWADQRAPRSRRDSKKPLNVVTTTTMIHQTVEVSEGTSRTGTSRSRAGTKDSTQELTELGDPPLARALLLFAQMSSEGNLMDEEYTAKCVEVARANSDFVLGFIAQQDLNTRPDDNFITMTPGVKLPPAGSSADEKVAGDGLGQQYRTPKSVILGDRCDIVIVGRGIIGAKDRAKEAARYREEAWKAYQARLESLE